MPDHRITFDYTAVTPGTVEAATNDALARANRLVDRAARGPAAAASTSDGSAPPTFDETLRTLDEALGEAAIGYGRGAFMGHVHPDAEVRETGSAAEERLAKWRAELPFRDDLYAAVRAFAETPEAAALTGERARLLDHWLREFRRAGQELPAAERAELRALRARLVELEVAFQRNIGEFHGHIEVTRGDLGGLPESYVERLKPGGEPGTYLVSLQYPEVVPFMELAKRRDLREQLEFKEWTKTLETNEPVLAQALALRRRMAELLGFPSWAHVAMDVRMAKEPAAVLRLYEGVVPPMTLKAQDELAEMRAALLAETGDDVVRPWDFRYLDAQLRRTTYGVDTAVVSEYFPLEQVMDGLLDLTNEVFGLRVRRVEDTRAWHPDVRLYEISDGETGDLVAYAYADLFPREGKFGHAAAFPLVIAHRDPKGRRVTPISAIVANFTPPSRDQPALLRHEEVVTLFHEYGHILHMSLSQAEFVRFSGGDTESDFVEAPSQIMEHWAWNAAVLQRFARHHRTGAPIPVELVDQLVAARRLDVALKTLRQVYFGRIDLAFHGEDDPGDLHELDRDTYAVTGLPFHEGTFFAASFGHLMGGYDAGYYGYLWSKVFGDDMFSRFEADGITSQAVGRDYRREVLEPNGSADAEVLLRNFLGREPSNAAFLRHLGLAEVEAQPAG